MMGRKGKNERTRGRIRKGRRNRSLARIQISSEDREVYVGEEQPPLTMEVTSDTEKYNKRIRLEKKKKFTAEDLLLRLQRGEGVSLVCDADLSVEGTYPVRIELGEKLKEKLGRDWEKKVRIQIKEGALTVKNPVGRWKDGKLLSVKENQVDPSRPMVALTFDDGPGERTGEILDQMQKYGAHATFFMLGQKVPSYPALVKRMKESGCELGNHSYDHANLTKLDGGSVSAQIQKTNDQIRAAAGASATVMRPPYGAVNSGVAASVGMPVILWNIDTLDWKTRDARKTIEAVMGSVNDGDIILMHDIHTESVDAALELIPKLQESGYQLVTVSELAAARNAALLNGRTYTDF